MSTALKYVAFTVMALFGVLGAMFVAGETFADPGGWAAVGLTALWLVPLLALGAFGAVRPDSAGRLFVGVTGLVALFALLDALVHLVPRDVGPVAAVAVFTAGVSLAFLGLHRPRLAGGLLLVLSATQLVAIVLSAAVRGGGPGLGGSSAVVVLPLLLSGALFWAAGSIEHEPLSPLDTPHAHRGHHAGHAH